MVGFNNSINNTIGGSTPGKTNTLTITNSSNTAGSTAELLMSVGGTSAGNPYIQFTDGTNKWAVGMDESNTQAFTIAASNALGTSNAMLITKAGVPSFPLAPLGVVSGGTGDSSITAYAPVCGGTTTTGALQSASTGLSTAGYVLTSNGSSALPSWQSVTAPFGAFTSINVQIFTTSGTYTPTTNMAYCIVECIGGGGGAGACVPATAGAFSISTGGGGGGYSRSYFPAATIGASQVVTIGAGGAGSVASGGAGSGGGTTSVGALITANGGSGGAGAVLSRQFTSVANGGTPGMANIIAMGGQPSQMGFGITGVGFFTSPGGASFYCSSLSLGYFNYSGAPENVGASAVYYGQGAPGSFCSNYGAVQGGGDGFAGIVIVTEYIT